MRKARLLAEHTGYYHVILKATGPQYLFREDADKRAFQDILERSARFSGVGVLAYALLDNHFHLLVKVPERESVPSVDSPEFRARVEALYGHDRAARLFDLWERWEADGRSEEVALGRDRLLRRMHDLGQFMKTLKEWHSRVYREAHSWEGTLWRGRYKSIIVTESLDAFHDIALYIALNPVRAGIVKRGTDSPRMHRDTAAGNALRRGMGPPFMNPVAGRRGAARHGRGLRASRAWGSGRGGPCALPRSH